MMRALGTYLNLTKGPFWVFLLLMGLFPKAVKAQFDIQYVEIYAIPIQAPITDTIASKDIKKRCYVHVKMVRNKNFESLSSEVRKLKPTGNVVRDVRAMYIIKFYKGERKVIYLTRNKTIVNEKGEAAQKNEALLNLLLGLLPKGYD